MVAASAQIVSVKSTIFFALLGKILVERHLSERLNQNIFMQVVVEDQDPAAVNLHHEATNLPDSHRKWSISQKKRTKFCYFPLQQ